MITNDGKLHIKRFLAGQEGAIARSIAYGIGSSAETVNDKILRYEVDRADINLVSYDHTANKLIFKASIPETYGGIIYEIGLFNLNGQAASTSQLIAQFSSNPLIERWSGATFIAGQSRIGSDALSHTPAASGSTTSSLPDLNLNFSNNRASDIFKFAFYAGTTFTSALRVRFMTDTINYYDFNLGAQPSVGYQIVEVAKSAATPTGAPDWGSIKEIQVTTTSGAGGASDIRFDAIRVEDSTYGNSDYVLVARELLPAPFTKQVGKVQEVEFSLDITV